MAVEAVSLTRPARARRIDVGASAFGVRMSYDPAATGYAGGCIEVQQEEALACWEPAMGVAALGYGGLGRSREGAWE
jgi:hypothetical protein